MECMRCQKALSPNEIGLHKKLISRVATEYLCIECQAEDFGVTVERLQEKIRQFQRVGCTLFSPMTEEEKSDK